MPPEKATPKTTANGTPAVGTIGGPRPFTREDLERGAGLGLHAFRVPGTDGAVHMRSLSLADLLALQDTYDKLDGESDDAITRIAITLASVLCDAEGNLLAADYEPEIVLRWFSQAVLIDLFHEAAGAIGLTGEAQEGIAGNSAAGPSAGRS